VATEHGTLLSIPREKQLVRLYLPLQAADSTSASFDFDFKVCDWWTVYRSVGGSRQISRKGEFISPETPFTPILPRQVWA
jgi:hypothetical protein